MLNILGYVKKLSYLYCEEKKVVIDGFCYFFCF